MNIPGFAAEASLYKTLQMYRGYSGAAGGDAAPIVVPADYLQDCLNSCGQQEEICAGVCAVSIWSPPAFVGCEYGCYIKFLICLSMCQASHIGGPPPPPACCPTGARCCGDCVSLTGGGQRCTAECVGKGESCN